MKKVLNLNEVYTILDSRGELVAYQDINGHKYEIDYVNFLQMKLIDIMSLIKEQRLYRSEP